MIKAARHAADSIQSHIWWVNFFGTIFRGVSLGSILLVVALGLAITFGLMGVINMAHGEMIAVGAYTSYVVQNLFGTGFSFAVSLPFSFMGKQLGFGLHLPGLNATGWFYQSYFLWVIPLSFLTAALAGLVLERTVIQFLYRRPLESLLATWGVSLVMQQLFRMVFGANNVQVNSPAWLLGHCTVNDVSFGYNRLFVIAFAVLIVLCTWLLLTKTPLGLLIRAVMQNRAMASCMGCAPPGEHAHLRVRFRAGRAGGRLSFANRQRGSEPWAELYCGQFHDGGRGRRGQHHRHGLFGIGHRHGGPGVAADCSAPRCWARSSCWPASSCSCNGSREACSPFGVAV